jgi:hypothetical protein
MYAPPFVCKHQICTREDYIPRWCKLAAAEINQSKCWCPREPQRWKYTAIQYWQAIYQCRLGLGTGYQELRKRVWFLFPPGTLDHWTGTRLDLDQQQEMARSWSETTDVLILVSTKRILRAAR